jgi:hypothetical protein
MMRGHRSGGQTHPDAARTNRSQPTQESSQPGSPAEDNTARRSAQPWLQVAKRGDRQQQNASSSSAAIHSGCRTSAQGNRRKRGCRGHGALQKRAEQRRQKAAASQEQRDAQGRSGSNGLDSIASAMQSQSEAIMAMAEAVQQLGKQISNFLFAQRQSGQQRTPQRQDSNAGKTAELRKKGEGEWKMIEDKARAKLSEIRAERERQMERRVLSFQVMYPQLASSLVEKTKANWEKQIQTEFNNVDKELQKAMHQEKEYERCDYRRTHCKALQDLIAKHNRCKSDNSTSCEFHEEPNSEKYIFNQYGRLESGTKFLVDPERFWSYDLLRSREYGERPL